MIKGRMLMIASPKVMIRGLAKIFLEAMQEAGLRWHRDTLPKHFEPGASTRYQYESRTRAYRRRKQRLKGHGRPLEWSGTLKRAVTRMAQVTGSKQTVRVKMDTGAAWYATARIRKHKMPDIPGELTKVTRDEERRMARLMERVVADGLNRIKTRETRT